LSFQPARDSYTVYSLTEICRRIVNLSVADFREAESFLFSQSIYS
jgi:hypothetical protein